MHCLISSDEGIPAIDIRILMTMKMMMILLHW